MLSRRRLGLPGVCALVLLLAACGYGVTGVATNVTDTSATLTGTADNTEPGVITYWFEYGPTATYGSSTDHQTVAITAPIPVEALVDGLDPQTTYHYRLCVRDAADQGVCGKDLTLVTTGNSALRVNHNGDALDAAPGDGVCQDQAAVAGRCSLRAALQEANARAGDDVVIIQAGVGTITLTRGELLVASGITLRGNGATVNAADASRVLNVGSGRLTLERATLTGGRAPFGGGLLVAAGANATVSESTVTDNDSTGLYACIQYFSGVSPGITIGCSGVGGGAGIFSNGALSISRSTVSANHAIGGGCTSEPVFGAGYATTCTWSQGAGVRSSGGVITDSTISGNFGDTGSGNALSATTGTVAVSRSTIVDNLGNWPTQLDVCCSAEGNGLAADGTITVQGSIVDGAAQVCGFGSARVSSLGYNLVSDSSCGFTKPGDQQGVDPLLGSLAANGGPTRTQLPFANSPAVDAIPAGTPGLCDAAAPKDQRSMKRPQGPKCDIGAVEGDSGTTPGSLSLVVNNGGDDTDAAPGDGVCRDAAGPVGACSLRAAIAEANAWPGPDAITINPGVNVNLTRTTTAVGSDVGDLDVTEDLTIDGGGAVINAAGINPPGTVYAVLDVTAADLNLSRATVTGGTSSGIRFDAADHELRLTAVTVRGNSGVQGGGVYLGGGSVTIARSTISGNTSLMEGGGVYTRTGTLTMTDSTVSGNATTATDSISSKGAGVYVLYGSGTITRSTIAANAASAWGAVYSEGAETTLTLSGTALANPGPECGGVEISAGFNRAEDTTCAALSQPSDQQNVALLLGALANNGGPTFTHLPAGASPLLNAIPTGTVGLCTSGLTDQRGVTRPRGTGCDIGAVEVVP